MKRKLLLSSQRVEVDALIRGTTLNPSAFHWGVTSSETMDNAQVSRLEYSDSHSRAYFQFDLYRRQHYALYRWDDGTGLEEHWVGSWPHQVLHVARWMAHLEDHARREQQVLR